MFCCSSLVLTNNMVVCNLDHKYLYMNTCNINSQEWNLLAQRVNVFARFTYIAKIFSKEIAPFHLSTRGPQPCLGMSASPTASFIWNTVKLLDF